MRPIRRILLWVMLASLAAAAVLGAFGIFTSSNDFGWLAGTATFTAIAVVLMIPASLMADKPASRLAGLFGMGAVAATYLTGNMLFWSTRLRPGDFLFWLLVGATCSIPAVTPPTMGYLRLINQPRDRVAGVAGLLVCFMAFFLAMVSAGSYGYNPIGSGDTPLQLLGTGGVVAGFGMLGTLSLLGWTPVDRRYWRWLGVIAALVGCAISIIGVWAGQHGNIAPLAVTTGIAVVIGFINLMLLVQLPRSQAWLRWLAVAGANVAVWLTVAVVIKFELLKSFSPDAYWNDPTLDLMSRIAGAAAFVVGCCVLAMAILERFNRRRPAAEPGWPTQIMVQCPRCMKKQAVPLGRAGCTGCELVFITRIEDLAGGVA